MSEPDGPQLPPTGSGRGRRLSRERRSRRPLPDTGRRHHIGQAPPVLAFVRPDGTTGTTRTSPIQLSDQPVSGLKRLAAQLAEEMAAACAALDFEAAAQLRDEAAAVRAELDRRVRDDRSGG